MCLHCCVPCSFPCPKIAKACRKVKHVWAPASFTWILFIVCNWQAACWLSSSVTSCQQLATTFETGVCQAPAQASREPAFTSWSHIMLHLAQKGEPATSQAHPQTILQFDFQEQYNSCLQGSSRSWDQVYVSTVQHTHELKQSCNVLSWDHTTCATASRPFPSSCHLQLPGSQPDHSVSWDFEDYDVCERRVSQPKTL